MLVPNTKRSPISVPSRLPTTASAACARRIRLDQQVGRASNQRIAVRRSRIDHGGRWQRHRVHAVRRRDDLRDAHRPDQLRAGARRGENCRLRHIAFRPHRHDSLLRGRAIERKQFLPGCGLAPLGHDMAHLRDGRLERRIRRAQSVRKRRFFEAGCARRIAYQPQPSTISDTHSGT